MYSYTGSSGWNSSGPFPDNADFLKQYNIGVGSLNRGLDKTLMAANQQDNQWQRRLSQADAMQSYGDSLGGLYSQTMQNWADYDLQLRKMVGDQANARAGQDLANQRFEFEKTQWSDQKKMQEDELSRQRMAELNQRLFGGSKGTGGMTKYSQSPSSSGGTSAPMGMRKSMGTTSGTTSPGTGGYSGGASADAASSSSSGTQGITSYKTPTTSKAQTGPQSTNRNYPRVPYTDPITGDTYYVYYDPLTGEYFWGVDPVTGQPYL